MFILTVTDTTSLESLGRNVTVTTADSFEEIVVEGYKAVKAHIKSTLEKNYTFSTIRELQIEVEEYQSANIRVDVSVLNGKPAVTWQDTLTETLFETASGATLDAKA